MCKVLMVSRSGYYKWLKRESVSMNKHKTLDNQIRKEFEKSRNTYGAPRLTKKLNEQGIMCSKATIARRMRKQGLVARRKLKYKNTTDSKHGLAVAPNLLNRQFEAKSPGKAWVSDITYIRVLNYFIYLTVIIDLADRMVVGWSISRNLDTRSTVIKAFKNACRVRMPQKGFIFHSDRGVQYACNEFKSLLKKYKANQSMSRKGDCWDNAVAESFFKTLKVECLYRRKINSNQMAYSILFDYINGWYNTVRIHSAIGFISPLNAFKKMSKLDRAA